MQSIWRYDPTSLKLFVAACEEGSIARAAERESMVPSAVSKRIAELEEAVGAPLLYRHQKGIAPTAAGTCLLAHARHLLDELTRMSVDLAQFTDGQRGQIRVSANRSSIIQFLPQDLSTFQGLHPQIAIELQERTSEEVLEAVQSNQADVGIGTDFGEELGKGLQVHDYHVDHLVLVVPKGHPLADEKSICFADTLGFSHIALHRNSPLYRVLEQAAKAEQKTINYGVHLQSFDAVCRMIQANMGVAVIPRDAISVSSTGVELISIPLIDPWAVRRFQIVSRGDELLLPVCRQFIDFLKRS